MCDMCCQNMAEGLLKVELNIENTAKDSIRKLEENLKEQGYIRRSRPSMDETYLNVAKAFAERSSCLRRGYGAVLARDNTLISTGYNGGYRGGINCCDKGKCKREELNIPPGERYELCESIHAEVNACLNTSTNLKNSTLYLYGIDFKTGKPVEKVEPCKMCERVLKTLGIKELKVYKDGEIKTISLHVDKYFCGRNGVF